MKPARRLPGVYAAGLLGAGELVGNPLRRSPRRVRRRRRVIKTLYVEPPQNTTPLLPLTSTGFYPDGNSPGKDDGK